MNQYTKLRILRYEIRIDDTAQKVPAGKVVLVHAHRKGLVNRLEVWIQVAEGETQTQTVRVFGKGQEIPAGVYDVNWNQGSGFLGWDTQSSYHLTYYGGDGFNGTVVFHSLPLTEGDTLTLECYSNEDCILWLTPVAEIYG